MTAAPSPAPPDAPLLALWTTPHGVPPFDRIADAHFLPAFDAALAAQAAEIEAIAACPDAPTFENTAKALEQAGQALRRVLGVFFALHIVHTNDTMQDAAKAIALRLAATDDVRLFTRLDAVRNFLDRLWTPALARATAEAADLEALLRADGYDGLLHGHDWWFYAERLRAKRYAFDDAAVRPYFELTATRDRVFRLARRLWGITFTPRPDLPVYHEDVEAWEVKEADGAHAGLGYTPVVFNVCNVPAPTPGQPTLLTFDKVTTLYHEFGHALHGLFSRVYNPSVAGTSVSRDFVEFPSQIMENWPGEPAYLAEHARHYQSGAPLPAALLDEMHRAAPFNEGFRTAEYLAASYLDLAWHSLTAPTVHDAEAFERAEMDRIGLPTALAPRYRSGVYAASTARVTGAMRGCYGAADGPHGASGQARRTTTACARPTRAATFAASPRLTRRDAAPAEYPPFRGCCRTGQTRTLASPRLLRLLPCAASSPCRSCSPRSPDASARA